MSHYPKKEEVQYYHITSHAHHTPHVLADNALWVSSILARTPCHDISAISQCSCVGGTLPYAVFHRHSSMVHLYNYRNFLWEWAVVGIWYWAYLSSCYVLYVYELLVLVWCQVSQKILDLNGAVILFGRGKFMLLKWKCWLPSWSISLHNNYSFCDERRLDFHLVMVYDFIVVISPNSLSSLRNMCAKKLPSF